MYRILLLLLLFATSLADEDKLSMKRDALIIADFKKFFYTGCVFLITSDQPSFVQVDKLSSIAKHLAEMGLASAQINFSTLGENLENLTCLQNQPLFVLIANEFDVQINFVEKLQLTSYPRWLVLLEETKRSLDEIMIGVNIPFDSEVFVAQTTDYGTSFTEVYRVHKDLVLNQVPFGRWNPLQRLQCEQKSLYERRNGLLGYEMRAATLKSPPIITFTANTTDGLRVSRVGGYFGEVWTVLQERMNFTTAFFHPGDLAYGSQTDNGSWNGMVGMLLTNEADVAINEFSMTLGRARAVDSLLPLIFTRSSVFIKQPEGLSLRWGNFLDPFTKGLWLAIGQSIVVMSAILSFTYTVGRRFGNADAEGPHRYTFFHSLFTVFACFCQQGDDASPKSYASRTVHLLVGVTSIIVLAAYSGGLVSSLTILHAELPFTTFQGMLDNGRYKLRVLAKSGKLNLLESSTDPLLKKLYTKLLLPEIDTLPRSVLSGLKELCANKKKYAFMTAYDIALGMMEELLPCRLVTLPNAALPDSAGMLVPKDSPYQGILNFNLQYLRNAGVLNRLRVNAWSKSMPETMSSFNSVTINAVTPIITILVSGVITGVLLLLAELIARRLLAKLRHSRAIGRGRDRFRRTRRAFHARNIY